MSMIGPVQSRCHESSPGRDGLTSGKNGKADGMNLEVDSKDEVMHI